MSKSQITLVKDKMNYFNRIRNNSDYIQSQRINSIITEMNTKREEREKDQKQALEEVIKHREEQKQSL